jgi:phosphatidate cytidylyltransferase
MLTRIMTGLLLAGGSVLIIYWGTWPLALECLLITILGLAEFYQLARRKEIKPSAVNGIFAGVCILLSATFLTVEQQALLLLGMIILTKCIFIFRKDHHKSSYLDAGVTILGYIYLAWMFSFILHLRRVGGDVTPFFVPMSTGAALTILLAMGNAMSDVASFFTGKFLGRTKLCPGISPGKTVEGFLGGLLCTVLFVLFLGRIFHFPVHHSIIMGVLLVVVATLGDLWESVLKRDVGVKDSGSIVIGHGGIMDRFDSLIFTAPVIYLYVRYFFI